MDVAYNQHSPQARRQNRSSTNLNHLSLAPLTTKLPLPDHDSLPESLTIGGPRSTLHTSYLQGKSAPATPSILTRSPARSRSRDRKSAAASTTPAVLPKSRSTTYLGTSAAGPSSSSSQHHRRPTSGAASPNTSRWRRGAGSSESSDDTATGAALSSSSMHRSDSDWLLRAGAIISSETRESKGQAWLATRDSSTSLSGLRGVDEEALGRERAREREMASRSASRRGSLVPPPGDDAGVSAGISRTGSRSRLHSPLLERRSGEGSGYFPEMLAEEEDDFDAIPGPDFVGLDEKLEALGREDSTVEDEDHVRQLVKREKASVGGWFGSVIGWPLFAVQENEEEEEEESDEGGHYELADGGFEDEEDGDEEEEGHTPTRRRSSVRRFEGDNAELAEANIPPPRADEGGWQDAAWLLSVASKVIL